MTFERYEDMRIATDRKFFEARSKWDNAVCSYASELIESIIDEDDLILSIETAKDLEEALLNGASNWKQYSWGGCSLIYDTEIACRTCTTSELKKTEYGQKKPNSREEWLDVQARALYQASMLLKGIFEATKAE